MSGGFMSEKVDVVVIGAGLGGLTTAGYLAKQGRSVLVLEHHTIPGGYAHEFKRRGYRFEVALHALDGASPGGWAYQQLADLEVFDQVDFRRMDPFYTVEFPDHKVVAHADLVAYEAELISHFPNEVDGIRSLIDAMVKTFFDVRRFVYDGENTRRPVFSGIPNSYPHMIAAMGQSWEEFMSAHIESEELASVFSTLWVYYGLPPSQLNAATFILPWVSYHLYGAYYPEGGSMAMSRALETTIMKYGGELRYRQDVDGIEVVDGKAVAVTTTKGLRVEADLIISNANPNDTMLRFIGPDHLPDGYAESVKEATDRPALGSLVVYLGLEKDLIAEGWPYHELFLTTTYDLEDDYAAMREGRWEDVGLVISHYDHVDPTCSPEGSSVMSITTLASWDYADQWGTHGDLDDYSDNERYLEIKDAAGQTLVNRVAELIPGLKESIVHIEIGTPITNWRYSLNPSGSIYGSEQTVENMYMNRLSERTPIANVFLTGAWVFGGGMSAAMLSGRSVARRADSYFVGGSADNLFAPDLEPDADDEPVILEDERRLSTPAATTAPTPRSSHTLTAAVSGREIDFASPGLPTVLVFHDQDSVKAGVAAVIAVRSEHEDAASVTVANVVDLQSVPKLFRKFAETSMRKSYARAEEGLSEGKRAEDYVVILADWDGSATQGFGFSDMGEDIGVVVLDTDGEIVGFHRGENATDEALEDLRRVAD